jgi:hypothetical protein
MRLARSFDCSRLSGASHVAALFPFVIIDL